MNIKAIIRALGLGTRISEEMHLKPKPMIEIGGRPVLWHIMKTYSSYSVNDFIIFCGYKGYVIKEFFLTTFCICPTSLLAWPAIKWQFIKKTEPWRVTHVDTDDDTLTGGRLKRVANYVRSICVAPLQF